ncbi:Serine/threonine-protein kinase ATG1 [Rhynchospora pubera]|uniref:Serine/threonine-protein kinase ATG1 n=1 Tax=Rhynchospora pubera TaxID=906938 RepID=A0AAV8FEI2_9POAL|nr:Serine/threonine-protein kinase ATG1 [Rhynchospora pubera]
MEGQEGREGPEGQEGREGREGRRVGEYVLGKQIGSGAFSVVWQGLNKKEDIVAVKEISLERLNKKLRDSLLSEVSILRRVHHPNIIALLDSIHDHDRHTIFLILEFCPGGDLSSYILRRPRLPEPTAKHFMRQLAAGLQVLRANNVVHRDLKPQNILLSTNHETATLKIADFGFAKSLNPSSMAETLCGSPLYMAPEVMQLHKYDAKADLWSLGVILYQLVTGRTPYNGANQIQLLQNILKSNELTFPPDVTLSPHCIDLCTKLLRRNPVERLTVEEFLNHPFLVDNTSDRSLRTSSDAMEFAPVKSSLTRPSGQSSHDYTMPFPLDTEPVCQDVGPFVNPGLNSSPSNRFPIHNRFGRSPDNSPSRHTGPVTRYGFENNNGNRSDNNRTEGMLFQPRRDYTGSTPVNTANKFSVPQAPPGVPSPEEPVGVTDSMEFLKDYVVVAGPHMESPSSSATIAGFHAGNSPSKSEGSPAASPQVSRGTAPMPIPPLREQPVWRMESPSSPGSAGSVEIGEAIDRPSSDNLTRIKSLQQCASDISDLVKQEKQLRALSLQLVVLAIWKQAMQICHRASAASAVIEGSPSHDKDRRMRSKPGSYNNSSSLLLADTELADAICTHIEKDFLVEVTHAEELASCIGQISDATEMPDAIEIIFQSALTSGRDGGVDEMMGNIERALSRYCRAVSLLRFLLVEAPMLDLNPPFSLTQTDRYRLRSYIEVLNGRLGQLWAQRPAAAV